MTPLWLLLLACGVATASDDDYTTHVADAPQRSAYELWQDPGFRVQLGVGYDFVDGYAGVPPGAGLLVFLQPGLQLSHLWSLEATMRYAVLSGTLSGVRVAVTGGATVHPVGGLALSLATGYAGGILSWNDSAGSAPYNLAGKCDGVGAVGQARLGYLFALSEAFATGPVLQAEILTLQCAPISVGASSSALLQVPRWWQHTASFAWVAAWR